MENNRKQIASEYKEFVDLAGELAKKDVANYPLQMGLVRVSLSSPSRRCLNAS